MLKIKKISVPKTKVYDITVDNSESFFANNILVHNCTEILLHTNNIRTAVCCLASANLEYYDEWKDDKLFLSDLLEMLDNALQVFIDTAPDELSKAKLSASRERSVGVGALGFHSYLQKNNIPFESALATATNHRMFKHIRKGLDEANLRLGKARGCAPDAEGYSEQRMSYVMAVAPNASSSIIMGNCSPSIEPLKANVYLQDTTSGKYVNKNKYLDNILKEKLSQNKYEEVWSSIISKKGSVSHLSDDILDGWQKDVFKTAMEIDQRWIITHAEDRQQYIDQGQSVNLFLKPDVNVKYLHDLHFQAWKRGLKTLYYVRSEKAHDVDKVGEQIKREEIQFNETTCLACE